MPYHTLLPTLLFFFLSYLSSLFFSAFYFFLCFQSSLFFRCFSFFVYCAQLRPFYIAYRDEIYRFTPQLLLAQCGCTSRATHQPASCSAITTTLCWLRSVLVPDKRSFLLFCFSLWHSHPNKGWVFSFTNSYGMHLVILAHLSLFQLVCHPSRNPRIYFPMIPTTRLYLFLPLTHGPPCLYWLGISGWCLSLVHAPLPCESVTCLLFMCLSLHVGLSGFAACLAACF